MKGMSTKEGLDVTNLTQYLELKKSGFEFDGQSYLFWEFMRVKHIVKPKYFLLENVRIQKKWKDIFDEVVGVEPIMINSALVSAQNRVRYYWTNLPDIQQPKDRGILLKDVVLSGKPVLVGEQGKKVLKRDIEKSACLLARDYKGFGNQGMTATEERPCELREIKSDDSLCKHVADATDINGHDSLKRVYDEEGKSPAVNTCGGGNREVKVLCGASRGRYLVDGVRQDGKMLTAGKTTQYLEVRGDEKTNCLTTVEKDNYVTDKQEAGRYELKKSTYRRLTPLEYERLQTVDEGYTEGVSNSQRYKMLGNGFTIEVVAHILKNIPQRKMNEELQIKFRS